MVFSQNGTTRFYGFSGNMITLEYFRGTITNIVFGYCMCGVVALAVSYIRAETGNKGIRKNR